MKILVTGATGRIGSRVVAHCLARPEITCIVALSRRELEYKDKKLITVIVKDFLNLPEDVLREHGDAECMLWCMGALICSIETDFEMPVAFIRTMSKVVAGEPRKRPFRFVLLSGVFVEQDEGRWLWFLEHARKTKGRTEAFTLKYGEEHSEHWQSQVVRAGIVVANEWYQGLVCWALGENYGVRAEDFAAYAAWLAVEGKDEGPLVVGARSVRKGREVMSQRPIS